MMYYTHLAFSFFLSLFVYPLFSEIPELWFFGFALFGALLPDIDHPESIISKWLYPLAWVITTVFRHRGVVHSLFFGAGLFFVVTYYFTYAIGVPLALGFLSHVVIDSITIRGINYLYPLTTLKVSGFIETGKTAEMLLFLFLLVLIAAKVVFF